MGNSDHDIQFRNQPLGYLEEAEAAAVKAQILLERRVVEVDQASAQAQLAHARALMALASAILHHTTHQD